MSVFQPHAHVQWLGNVAQLSILKKGAQYLPLPLKTVHTRSYITPSKSSSIKAESLQTDLQKVLRYARSLPHKKQLFVQE
jgi:hypothetical protein